MLMQDAVVDVDVDVDDGKPVDKRDDVDSCRGKQRRMLMTDERGQVMVAALVAALAVIVQIVHGVPHGVGGSGCGEAAAQ